MCIFHLKPIVFIQAINGYILPKVQTLAKLTLIIFGGLWVFFSNNCFCQPVWNTKVSMYIFKKKSGLNYSYKVSKNIGEWS